MNRNGQVLVETTFAILLLAGMYFGLIQLTHLSIMRLVAFDVSTSACRASIVEKNHTLSALYVFSSQQIPEVVIPTKVQLISENGINTVRINYVQKVMFPSFFSLFGIRFLPNSAVSKMVKSPNTEYFYKSYYGAKKE